MFEGRAGTIVSGVQVPPAAPAFAGLPEFSAGRLRPGWPVTAASPRRSAKAYQTKQLQQKDTTLAMKHELGLLWIPAGFLIVFLSVAALFLTI
jgi:hypothetical protein